MKQLHEVRKNKIVWVYVWDSNADSYFWMLGVYNGSGWVGVIPWDDYQNHSTLEDYELHPMGWEELVEPYSESGK
jgi:hypothetical protein